MAGSRSEREVKVRFTGESQVLQGSAGEVRKVFQMLESDLNDTRSSAEKMAAAQSQVADSMRKDMADIAKAADVVRDSLGRELTAAIDSSGRSVEDYVQQWRKAGVSLQDIMIDSDKLADSLRHMDDAARQGTGAVGDGLKKIEEGSGRARANMANFAGNVASELPGVANALGPLNVGIGQMVEGLAEGEIGWKQLLGAGLAMGAVSLVLAELTDDSEELAAKQREAMSQKLVEQWTTALRGAVDPVAALTAEFEKSRKVMALIGVDKVLGDITGYLADAGVSAEEWSRAVYEGGQAQADFEAKVRSSGMPLIAQTVLLQTLSNSQEVLGTTAGRAADELIVFGGAVEDSRVATVRGGVAAAASAVQVLQLAAATDRSTKAMEAAEEAQHSLTDARLAAIDQDFAFRSAQDALTTSLEALANATDDPTTGVDEMRQAQDAAAQAAIAMASAYQTSAEQLSAVAGAPLTAAESQQKFIESLYQTALALDPSSPLRAQLVGYINMLQSDIPAEANTKIIMDAEDANTRIGFHRQKNLDAKAAVDDLKTSLDGLPPGVDLAFSLLGYDTTMSQLLALKNRLKEVKTEADNADRAVGRVAG